MSLELNAILAKHFTRNELAAELERSNAPHFARFGGMKQVMSETNALTLQQASRYIGVSQAAMRTWKRDGKGPSYFRAGKLLRYRKRDLDVWIEARLVNPEEKQ